MLLLLLPLSPLHLPPPQKCSIIRQRLKPKMDNDKGQWHNQRDENPPPVGDGKQKAVGAEEDRAEE